MGVIIKTSELAYNLTLFIYLIVLIFSGEVYIFVHFCVFQIPLGMVHLVLHNWGEHERAPHRRPKHVKICIYVCTYLCLCQRLIQIVLNPIATLYDNGLSGRVQNSSRASNYPCMPPCASAN